MAAEHTGSRNRPGHERAARVFARFVGSLSERMDPALAQVSEDEVMKLLADAGQASASAANEHADWQDRLIEQQVPNGASVLDLGCGNGELLKRLIDRKRVRGQGVELQPSAVAECVARGVPVVQCDLDAGLKGFSDRSFDYVVLEETLQTLHRPIEIMQEMLRVGKRGIVSFPNFAFWQIRFDLALRGRMPVTTGLPRPWYETANIHLFTLQDFLDWTGANGVRIIEAHVLAGGAVRPMQSGDNLYAEEALAVVEKK